MRKLRLLGTLTGPSGSHKSVSIVALVCSSSMFVSRCSDIFLFSLSREASQSPHWDSLEPLIPVLHPHTDHIWEKDTLQWWGAVLGAVARWLLLDPIHDHRGLSGVLHSTDHYQVRAQGAGPNLIAFLLYIFRSVTVPESFGNLLECRILSKTPMGLALFCSRVEESRAFTDRVLRCMHCAKWLIPSSQCHPVK